MKVYEDREEAGRLLAGKLGSFAGGGVVVYGLPRGGVVTAAAIAQRLGTPLDVILTRKIGHPSEPEYAIAAVAEHGAFVRSERSHPDVDQSWIRRERDAQMEEITRRRKEYTAGRKPFSPAGKTAILVDDGVATGLTLRAAIKELKRLKPRKLVVAVPVIPRSVAGMIEQDIDELVTLQIPDDYDYLGAVGAYYRVFQQVQDQEVIDILNTSYEKS